MNVTGPYRTDVDQDLCRHMASLDNNVLIQGFWTWMKERNDDCSAVTEGCRVDLLQCSPVDNYDQAIQTGEPFPLNLQQTMTYFTVFDLR